MLFAGDNVSERRQTALGSLRLGREGATLRYRPADPVASPLGRFDQVLSLLGRKDMPANLLREEKLMKVARPIPIAVALVALALTLVDAARAERPDFWLSGQRLSVEADPEFQYFYPIGAAPWIEAHEQGEVVHLLFEFPPRILRYDMAAETWLTSIVFAQTPTAMAIDADGLYVAFGAEIVRYALDGSSPTPLSTASFSIQQLLVDGSLLFVSSADLMESIDKSTGAILDSENYFYSMTGLSIASSADRIYARSVGVSPSDILVVPYSADGTLGIQDDSSYHGDYPGAVRTWTYPGDGSVVENSGIVYTGLLTYEGSVAGPFDDLAFHATGPILLRGGDLYAHGWDFLETGRFELSETARSIFVRGDSIYAFFESTNGADVVEVPKADLVPPQPGPPVDPSGLAYAPDSILVDEAGVVYLLSIDNLSVFRWSRTVGEYISTFPLAEAPQRMAYSAANGRIYLDHASGKVTEIDITAVPMIGGVLETPVLNTPQTPCGLATAGPWIFLCDPTGAWVSHFTFSPDGSLVSQEEWNYYSDDYEWSGVNERMYHLRDDTSPNDVLWEMIDAATGVIGTHMDSPLHDSTGMIHPIRVHPDGLIVLLGSGRYHNAITLELLEELGTPFVDAQWVGGHLVTLHPVGEGSELRLWNDFLSAVEDVFPLPGQPLRLLVTQGALIAVTSVSGQPHFLVNPHALFTDGFESGDLSAWSATAP